MGHICKYVHERAKAFSHTKSCEQLGENCTHFLTAALEDFEWTGLALSNEDGPTLKKLLEEDDAVCSVYGKNLMPSV